MKLKDQNDELLMANFKNQARDCKDKLEDLLNHLSDDYDTFKKWWIGEHPMRWLYDILKWGNISSDWKEYVDAGLAKKIDLLGNEQHSGLPYNFTYYYSIKPEADKIVATVNTITLDNNKTLGVYSMDIPAATLTTAGLMTASDKVKLGNTIELLGTEKGSGEQYHFPYNFTYGVENNKLKVRIDTITLDNTKTLKSYEAAVDLGTSGGKIDDVTVDGTSVVENKVAKIDLTPYAKSDAVTTISNNLASEVTRAKGAESTNATAISAETTARENADNTLQSNIDGKIDLLGKVPGTQNEMNLPYYFYITIEGNKIIAHCKTVSLDNTKTYGDYQLDALETDGTTIKVVNGKLAAQLPDVMVFKGSKTYVSEVLALTGMTTGDVWFAEKDDRTEPQASAPTVNALVCYNGTNWVYVGSTEVDMSEYMKTTDADAKYATKTALTTETTNRETGDTTNATAISAEESRAQSAEKDLDSKIDGKIDLLGEEEHSGLPYNFTYYYAIKQEASKIVATVYTITLDNNKSLGTYSMDIPCATDKLAGLMSASDKAAFDNFINTYYTKTETDTLLATKQSKVIYSDAEPTTAADGDVWVNEGDSSTTYEETSNKVTAITSTVTDTQYPSAKAVYDFGVKVSDTGTSTADLPAYMTVSGVEYKVPNAMHLYKHTIICNINGTTYTNYFIGECYSTSSTQVTDLASMKTLIGTIGNILNINGGIQISGSGKEALKLQLDSSTLNMYYISSGTATTYSLDSATSLTFTDTVTQIF